MNELRFSWLSRRGAFFVLPFSVSVAVSGCSILVDSDESSSQNSGDNQTGRSSAAATSGSEPGNRTDGGSSPGSDGTQDNRPAGANELGELTAEPASFGRHTLSDTDRVDYFKFSVRQFGKVTVRVKQEKPVSLKFNVTSAKSNANQSDKIEWFEQAQENQDHSFALPRGDYFLAAETRFGDYASFELSMFAVSPFEPEADPEPGNHFDEALKLGSIGQEPITVQGYVGRADLSDMYHFDAAPNRNIKISPRFELGEYKIELYRQDHVSGELVRSWTIKNSNRDDVQTPTDEGGGFFVKVVPFGLFGIDGVMYKLRIGLVD